MIKWPAHFPDLNPIEIVWSVFVRAVYSLGKQYSDITSLEIAIENEWTKIIESVVQDLVSSVQKNCLEVFKFKEGNINYQSLNG